MKGILLLAIMASTIVLADVQPLMIGQPVPEGSLQTVDNKAFDLREEADRQPLAVVFYRGGWCPYCNRHLAGLQAIDPQLRDLGYRILAISPDRPEKLAETVDKDHLTYTLLSDSSMAMAKAFGIAFTVDEATLEKYKGYGIDLEASSGEEHHMLPVPSVFLVGTDGIIDFVYSNPDYKVRLDPDVLLAAAKVAVRASEKK